MNPLSDHTKLFIGFDVKTARNQKLELVGVKGDQLILDHSTYGIQRYDKENATLIARPIESLTDEEIREMCNYKWDSEQCERMRNHLIQLANDGTLPVDSAIEISNRGLYPLSQEDFGDTVIDTRTLTNA